MVKTLTDVILSESEDIDEKLGGKRPEIRPQQCLWT